MWAIILLAATISSCHKSILLDLPDCDYSVELRYDYNEENSTTVNMLEYNIFSLDEFIFDHSGVLVRYARREEGDNRELERSRLDLPVGRYSVIAIGNRDERSSFNEIEVGVTHREDLLLSLSGVQKMVNNTYGNSERLYHGYETFTIKENNVSQIRIDMVDSHLWLEFRITWKNGSRPPRGSYYATLGDIPSEYSLMPQWIYPAEHAMPAAYSSDEYDTYLTYNDNVVHHILTVHQSRNLFTHRHDTKINGSGEMWGEFVTYRIKSTTNPTLRIFKPSQTKDVADTQIVKDISLQQYFDWYDYMLDTELNQYYAIDIVVDGNKVTLMPMDISDWDEGGSLSR